MSSRTDGSAGKSNLYVRVPAATRKRLPRPLDIIRTPVRSQSPLPFHVPSGKAPRRALASHSRFSCRPLDYQRVEPSPLPRLPDHELLRYWSNEKWQSAMRRPRLLEVAPTSGKLVCQVQGESRVL